MLKIELFLVFSLNKIGPTAIWLWNMNELCSLRVWLDFFHFRAHTSTKKGCQTSIFQLLILIKYFIRLFVVDKSHWYEGMCNKNSYWLFLLFLSTIKTSVVIVLRMPQHLIYHESKIYFLNKVYQRKFSVHKEKLTRKFSNHIASYSEAQCRVGTNK